MSVTGSFSNSFHLSWSLPDYLPSTLTTGWREWSFVSWCFVLSQSSLVPPWVFPCSQSFILNLLHVWPFCFIFTTMTSMSFRLSFMTLFLSSLCNHFPLTFTMVLMAFSYVMGTKESATPFSAASFLYLLLTDLYLWDLLTLVFLLLHDESPWNNLNSQLYVVCSAYLLSLVCMYLLEFLQTIVMPLHQSYQICGESIIVFHDTR